MTSLTRPALALLLGLAGCATPEPMDAYPATAKRPAPVGAAASAAPAQTESDPPPPATAAPASAPVAAVADAPAGEAGPAPKREKALAPVTGKTAGLVAPEPVAGADREGYAAVEESGFKRPLTAPLSTFSVDVDTASYANVRRMLRQSRAVPKGAVRIEEFINYFSYDYPQPEGAHPFSITTEVNAAPWRPDHRLVHIGLQGKRIAPEALPPANLVFLLDVSGSMNSRHKLPLLKKAFGLLVNQLRPQDRVSVVVYAGAAGLVLPPTTGDQKAAILGALGKLRAGGSTAGGAGIKLAYEVAQRHFVPGGNNRVILATDGDFNVGASSQSALVDLVEARRDAGVFLTVLGFGRGNYQDAKMELLADKGNGNAAYIDSEREAKKVLVDELGGTLTTIAKDVKIQVEFNPAKVKAYRLIGYENRRLAAADFNDDRKDAGEIGAGHTVTALYEVIPAGSGEPVPAVDALKYQRPAPTTGDSPELLTVKLRYKQPAGSQSTLITRPLVDHGLPAATTSDDFRFSAAVAAFGLLLRDSVHKGDSTVDLVLKLAASARGADRAGHRAEFIQLVQRARGRVEKQARLRLAH